MIDINKMIEDIKRWFSPQIRIALFAAVMGAALTFVWFYVKEEPNFEFRFAVNTPIDSEFTTIMETWDLDTNVLQEDFKVIEMGYMLERGDWTIRSAEVVFDVITDFIDDETIVVVSDDLYLSSMQTKQSQRVVVYAPKMSECDIKAMLQEVAYEINWISFFGDAGYTAATINDLKIQ
ncbi:MAG: hypothetical protein ACRCZJ_04090 [Erysipelotrichaceae bacterium]